MNTATDDPFACFDVQPRDILDSRRLDPPASPTAPTAPPSKPRKRAAPRELPLKVDVVVLVNGCPYLVRPLRDGERVYAFEFVKPDGECYQVTAASCDCPDAVYAADRPGGCKHRKALTALLGIAR